MAASACRLRCRPRAFGSLAASVRWGVAMAHLLRGLAGVRDRAHGQPEFPTILLNYTFSPQYALNPRLLAWYTPRRNPPRRLIAQPLPNPMHSLHRTDDLRIKWTKVVLPPVFLDEELPISDAASSTVFQARSRVSDILAGSDPRLLVVVGPCSIHDTTAAREYARLLKPIMEELSQSLCIVMRVYFEKPRTTRSE